MSSYVDKDYFYYLRGRELLLYKLLGSRNSDRITQSGVLQSYDNELVYPDEDIANGLRLEYTRVSEPFISESLETTLAYASSISISFTASSKFITTSADVWVSSGFEIGDKIRVDESAEQRIAINQIPKEDASPSSSSHINLNKMLSLAVVDYCKAMVSERNGEIDKKEYFMKEFYSKLADNESNKRIISVASPISAFAVK